MDFAQRGSSSTPTQAPAGAPAPRSAGGSKKSNKRWSKLLKWTSFVLLGSVTILILATILLSVLNKPQKESTYVNQDQFQAVFLNGGQVYFGKITALNEKYLAMNNIYYLRVNQTVQPNQASSASNDVSLVKLGCELHGPQDQMVINNTQIIFWENLKSDGQVAKAITAYQKANPNGQDCAAAAENSTPTTTDKTKKQ